MRKRAVLRPMLVGLALGIGLKPATFAATQASQAASGLSVTLAAVKGKAAEAGQVTNAIFLNFHSTPAHLILRYLSDAAGFVINQETEVGEPIDVWSNGPLTKEQAVEVLNSALKQHGYAVVRQGRILTVMKSDQAKTSDLEVVTGNDPDAVPKSDEVITQIIPVRYANVGQLVNNLGLLLPASASLSVNESANALILVSTRTDVRRMLRIISALDNAVARVSSIKVIPLRYADAKELATVVQQFFGSDASGQRAGGGSAAVQVFNPGGDGGSGPFSAPQPPGASASPEGAGGTATGAKLVAVADERSNSLIICGAPGLVPTLTDMVRRLDQQVNDTAELRIFRLRHADAGEVADQLLQLFPDDTTSGSTQQQAGLQFGGPAPPGGDLSGAGSAAVQSGDSDRKKRQSRVLAVADPRASSLLVSAGSTLMPQIAALIEDLDSDPGRKEVINFWQLRSADPQDVRLVLQTLFNRNLSVQNNDNNNPLLGQNNPLTTRQTQQQTSTTTTSSKPGSPGTGGAAASAGGF